MNKIGSSKRWVLALWVLNTVCIMVAGVGLIVFWDQTSFHTSPGIPTQMVLATLPLEPMDTITETVLPFTENTISSPLLRSDNTPTLSITETLTIKPSITPYIFITDTPTPRPWMEGPIVIGYSVQGRPLEMYRFGTGTINRMIVAGIHGGGEWNTIALADELITYLRDHPSKVPEGITLYILRNLNPDGEARGHGPEGRANEHGVDLNRNFPANWHEDWDRDGCWTLLPITGGSYAGSEPETVALMLFLQQHKIDALISYHSAALGIFAGGIPPEKASTRLAEAIAAMSTYSYPPLDTGCYYTGNLADWASTKGIAAIDIELTNHKDTDFEMNLDVLRVLMNWKR